MAQLWPKEVCRKFKVKNRFRNLNSDFKLEPAGPGGKIPALTMSTGLSTGLSTEGVDLPVDLPVDTACRTRVLGCTRSGFLARAGLGSRDFLNLTDLN